MTTYAVTGATGGLGSAAIGALIERGTSPADIVAVVRDPAKAAALAERGVGVRAADYNDAAALRTAFDGVDRLLFVSGSEIGQRVPQHTNVIEAAQSAGVGLIAYTSLLRADTSPLAMAAEHVETEKLLAASGLPITLLRNGWYWENYAGSAPAAIESGILYGSAGEGKVAGAGRNDYADAAAAALLSATGAEVYELAGSERASYADIAAMIAEVSGKPVRYQDIPESDLAAALAGKGIPEPVAAVLANSDAGVAVGGLDSTSSDLEALRGKPSTGLGTALRAALA